MPGERRMAGDGASPESTRKDAGSPLRWALVIVPVLVIGGGGAWLGSRLWAGLQRPQPPAIARPAERAPPSPAAEKARQEMPVREPRAAPAEAEKPAVALDVAAVVAAIRSADIADGQRTFRICLSCHTAERNSQARIGPSLWGVVGRPKASQAGFAYSQSLKAKGGRWSYEELARFLREPRSAVPGTKMTFAGITQPARLASLIAHLRTLSDSPVPLPDGERR